MQVPPVRYVDVDGLQVAYQVVGGGPVDLLYVPGMLNHMEATWDDADSTAFAERLGGFARLILLDKRGTGLSDRLPPGHHATVEQRTRDVLAVLDAVGSEAAFLFATADGTPIGMVAAAAHPDRVRGLVLYAPSARILADDGYPGLPHDKLPTARARTSRRWGDDQEPAHVQLLAPSRADDRRWRATIARMQRRSCTPRAAAEYWELNCRIDVRAVLPVIDVPTVVVHCSGDRVYRIEQGRYVARHLANVRWMELEGSDHLFFSDHGERVADEIEEFVTGRRSGPTVHRRLATVLFTDVVASTELDRALGDRRWRAVLDSHDQLTAAQVERHRGRVVKSTGDGCLAVFDGPQAAVAAALAVRETCAELGLRLRLGIHTGETEHRGDDLAGISVHIAARVMAEAEPGQILVTRTVRDLVIGSELKFAARGEHHLKGLDEAWVLYEVASDAGPASGTGGMVQ